MKDYLGLHICVPYVKCPFKCPMCVVGDKRYKNLYVEDREQYLKNLEHNKGIFNEFMLTGDSDPSLNTKWLRDVLRVLEGEKVEMQTRNYNLKGYYLKGLTALSYSITDIKGYLNAWRYRKIEGDNRLVILLTKDFEFLTAENFSPMGYNQITFKVIHEGGDPIASAWARKNKMQDISEIEKIVRKYNGSDVSVRLDLNCQLGTEHYRIMQDDGLLYQYWNQTPHR